MTTPGDPNEPRPGQDPREDRSDEDAPPQHEPEWWSEGTVPRDERPPGGGSGEERPPGGGSGEEPITPVPPVVPPVPPRPDVPPAHEPRPAGEPGHPDLPTSPETPQPTGSDAERTQVYPVPGATPTYPGWSGTPPEEPPGRPTPSRYDQGGRPNYGEPTVPGTSPSSPYGGPPGYPPPPGPYGHPYQQQSQPGSGLATASLVLGVASPFLVFVCFTGLITAILSIVFGCVALAKQAGRGRALAGIAISVLSLILFAIVAIWFWNVVQECAHLPGQLADRCFEDKFPWMNGSR
ncbi:hypothetical protein SAMN05444920_12984 [Nonomuraea solani]|uniref:DUF4190 domain-containing protein n=1 Tax=Nonomuraea solani TaxID=1144553 RepID=A0A1H6EXX1_9ACTN|nr:DUF4190 domain-containing protein [Nonomuraea solani]SEH02748.1 hypothetical protein SAMN05444920_12984 [Nonomuraea solani]